VPPRGMRGSPENRLPSSAEEGTLGRRPSEGWLGTQPQRCDFGDFNGFRTTPTAAAGCCPPSLPKEGNHAIFIERSAATRQKNEGTRALS